MTSIACRRTGSMTGGGWTMTGSMKGGYRTVTGRMTSRGSGDSGTMG